ncbi:MAG: alpha-amylase family glycosyl hydrolase [Thermodesulfovibrionales bacterium]|nr:alpha-amylase family glycosyl hydrolase [Thermodesulfovibrionales bacterium]
MPNKPRSLLEIDFKPHGKVFPSPSDWRDQFIYFLLVDRFHNGEKDIPPYTPDITPIGRDDSEGEKWQGGTLKGITEKLDYIKGLGCTALWLSPIFKNRREMNTYHGYGIQNFLDIDPRFGTVRDLQKLVKEAHKRCMYIILDIVLNHTGDNWSYPGGYPYYYSDGKTFDFGFWRETDPSSGTQWPDDAVWPVEFQNHEWYRRKGEIRNWDAFPEARDGDFCSLKELDTSSREVLKALIDVYKYWIAVADIDGYRLDAVKHIEDSSIAIFCNAIREYTQKIGKKNFFLYGEIIGKDEFIDQYIGRNARIPETNERFPSLDAALDFPLWGVLEWVIKGFINPSELRSRYERFREIYSDHGQASQYFVTFLDNHDQIGRSPRGRFLHNNPIEKQVILAIGYLLTSMGIPCIYYGTEQGFDGGGDHDKYLRECMFGGRWGAFHTTGHHFFNTENLLYKQISQIAEIRRREPALRYGRQYFREISGNGMDFGYPVDGKCTFAYSRILDDTEILTAMNLDSNPRNDFVTVDYNLTPAGKQMINLLKPESTFPVQATGQRHAVRVELAPHEMAVLKLFVSS